VVDLLALQADSAARKAWGYGDFKLLAALGAWLGWQLLPVIVLLSSVVGAGIGITLIVFRVRDHPIPLAFGRTWRSPARSRCSSARRSSKTILPVSAHRCVHGRW
jgi:Flp pilus assembly protein protease CpaA